MSYSLSQSVRERGREKGAEGVLGFYKVESKERQTDG